MKNSKFLLSSLIAAATMTAVPAWAEERAIAADSSETYTLSEDSTFTFTNNPTLTGSVSGEYTLTTIGDAKLATAFGDNWTGGNLIVNSGKLQWGQGDTNPASEGASKALGGNITVKSGAELNLWLWPTAKLTTSTTDKVAVSSKIILDGTDSSTAKLSTDDGSYYFSGGIQIGDGTNAGNGTFTAKWAKGHVIGALSGSGTFTINEDAGTDYGTAVFSIAGNGEFSGTVNFNYQSGNNAAGAELHLTENALKNATLNLTSGVSGKTATLSLDATTVNLKGLTGTADGRVVAASAGNTLALTLDGDKSFAGNIGTADKTVGLSISGSGRQTLSGENYLSSLSVSGSGTLSVASSGTLDLSGARVTLANAIENSGMVKVSSETVFDLASDGETTLISNSGSGSIDGWSELWGRNFTYNGNAVVGRGLKLVSEGVVNYDNSVEAKTLTWNGGASGGTWKTIALGETADAKPWRDSDDTDEAFYYGDSVTFSTENAEITVSGPVGPAAMTVSQNTTFTGTGTIHVGAANLSVAENTTLTLGENVELNLGNLANSQNISLSGLAGSGTVTVSKDLSLDHNYNVDFGKTFTGTINYSGCFNPNHTEEAKLGAATAKVNFTNVWFWSANSATIAQTLHFAGTENKITGGTLTLSGAITSESGSNFTISGATLNLSGSASKNFASLTMNSTSTLNISGCEATIGGGDLSSGTVSMASGAKLTFTGNTKLGALSADAGTITIEAGTLGLTGSFSGTLESIVIKENATLYVDNPSTRLDWKKMTLHAGAMFKLLNGAGTTSDNGHAESEILIDAAGSSATIAGSLYGNVTNILGKIHGTGTLNVTSGSTEWSNDLKISAVLADGVNDGDRLALNMNMGTGYWDNKIGTLILSGDNTYSGGTTITAGNLVAAHQNALGTGTVTVGAGTSLKLAADAVTVHGLAGAGTVGRYDGTAASTLTMDLAQSASSEFSGTFETGISITKTGTGTQILSNNSSGFAGTITIEAGTLGLTGSFSNALENIVIKENATLQLDSNNTTAETTWSKLTFEGGTFHIYDTFNADDGTNVLTIGEVAMSGNGTITSTYSYTTSGLTATLAKLSGTGDLTIKSAIEQQLDWKIGEIDSEYSGKIALVKNTPDLVVSLGAASAANADISVENGVALKFTGTGAYSLGTLTLGEGSGTATLSIASSSVTLKGLNGTGAISLDGTAASTLTVNGGGSFSGTLADGILLVKAGSGTLTLSGDNSANTSGVTIEAGTLIAAHAKALGTLADGKSLTVKGGANLQVLAGTKVDLGTAGAGVVLESGAKLIVDLTGVTLSSAETRTFEIMKAAVFTVYGQDLANVDDLSGYMSGKWELLGGDSAWLDGAQWALADNTLSLTLTIPEPSTFGLLAGLGALAFAGTRRRRKKA